MIVIFPLLMDNTISPNIVPGICATLEKFLIVYKSDAIMKMGGISPSTMGYGLARYGGELMVTSSMTALAAYVFGKYAKVRHESCDIDDIDDILLEINNDKQKFIRGNNIITEDFYTWGDPVNPLGTNMQKDEVSKNKSMVPPDKSSPEERLFSDVLKAKAPGLEVKTGKLDLNATLSLEPTYITLSGKWGTEVVGVKVLPVPVDPKPFIQQLLTDQSGEKTERFLEPIQRRLTGLFKRFMQKFNVNKNLKIDPFEDIIYATSKYGNNVFCLFNMSSLAEDDILKNFGGMDKAFKMGWNSIITADDLNKRAYFCMKEFGGICSTVNYSYIMASLTDKFEKTFDKLEDLKKSQSIYFKTNMKKPIQLMGESLAEKYTSRFAEISIPRKNCGSKMKK